MEHKCFKSLLGCQMRKYPQLVENDCKWENMVLNLVHDPFNRFQSRLLRCQMSKYPYRIRSCFIDLKMKMLLSKPFVALVGPPQ